MQESKGLAILGYIVIGIVLIPIAFILLYILLGISLFAVLYILARKKQKHFDPKDGKNYKLASSLILVIGAVIMILGFKINFNIIPEWNFSVINWQGYLWLQLLVFIGLIPMDIFLYRKIKE